MPAYKHLLCSLLVLVLSPSIMMLPSMEYEKAELGDLVGDEMMQLVVDGGAIEKEPADSDYKHLHSSTAVCIISLLTGLTFGITCYFCVCQKNEKRSNKPLKSVKVETPKESKKLKRKKAIVRSDKELEDLQTRFNQLNECHLALDQGEASFCEIFGLIIADCCSLGFLIMYTCKGLSGIYWDLGMIASILVITIANVLVLYYTNRAMAPRDTLRVFLGSFAFIATLIYLRTCCLRPDRCMD